MLRPLIKKKFIWTLYEHRQGYPCSPDVFWFSVCLKPGLHRLSPGEGRFIHTGLHGQQL